jgi:hypothetical protein
VNTQNVSIYTWVLPPIVSKNGRMTVVLLAPCALGRCCGATARDHALHRVRLVPASLLDRTSTTSILLNRTSITSSQVTFSIVLRRPPVGVCLLLAVIGHPRLWLGTCTLHELCGVRGQARRRAVRNPNRDEITWTPYFHARTTTDAKWRSACIARGRPLFGNLAIDALVNCEQSIGG